MPKIAVKIIQTGAKDGGNPRPFCIVAKAINLSASNDRDNLVGLRIGDEALCHVSLGTTRWGTIQRKPPSGPAILRAAAAPHLVWRTQAGRGRCAEAGRAFLTQVGEPPKPP